MPITTAHLSIILLIGFWDSPFHLVSSIITHVVIMHQTCILIRSHHDLSILFTL